MMQFTVPQFIDVEDKIFGPITVRQFVIELVTALLIALCYRLFDFSLFIVLGLFLFSVGTIFAFVRINGAPFHYFVLNLIETLKKPGLRVWYKDDTLRTGVEFDTLPVLAPVVASGRQYSQSRLNELSLIVDTQGSYQGESSDDVVIQLHKDIPADFS
ncbi:MAG: PrgI family protein [Candidatus Falkowbacteria bacterium]|nr:PrgI family protein [Candidatus Falkowbacteria bacterium]